MIGYVSVAAFYSAFDLLAARPALYTVDLLGRAVFRGQRDPTLLMFGFERDTQAYPLVPCPPGRDRAGDRA